METVYPFFFDDKMFIKRGGDALLSSKVSQAWVLTDLSRRKGDMGRLTFNISVQIYTAFCFQCIF
ncbi:hypothetical protein Lbys_1180 [Leadbetterella byssophila DSM 17132]|uniref:Uncharacterized protein n=1 Tax=Leadbetterella byssophila (strain DSM 17132 / JCM 16389 / KACC 11308 / NBRC 106382 / 4M15) TaxID=649349 RepID=E4RTP3_LEAB4|nr:hypothetical protein Lbys_1180 [Leadbetterella byssophila DSM 17132]